MKFKVKGLVFVGFAAAILSAGAYAETTDANTVTSKAYTDATYAVKSTSTTKFQVGSKNGTTQAQQWADLDTKVTGVNNDYVSVAANGTTGGVEIKMDSNKMTTTYTNGTPLSQSSTNLVTEEVVAKAIADSTSTAAGDYQPKTTAKIQVATVTGANNDPTWTGIDSAVQEATNGYVDISAADSNGVITFDIDAAKINNTGAALATASSSDKHLVTDYTLTSELNKKQDQQLGVAGVGGADSTDYEKLVYIGTDGKIAKSSLKVVDTVANDNLNPVTSNAVYDYVGTTLTNLPIPATMPDACKAANAHCALVTSYANNTVTAEWTVMAQAPAQQQAGL